MNKRLEYVFDPLRHLPKEVKATLFGSCRDTWIMHEAERVMILSMLRQLRPQVAIDCGTAQGGSLSAISKYAKKVYTLDHDPACKEQFCDDYPNAEFIPGDVNQTLPRLMAQINDKNENLEFVLLDAQHNTEGVRNEINALLGYKPRHHLFIFIHDSFAPLCREGILSADWERCPWAHFVELDFVNGVFDCRGDGKGSMTCGLAFALLRNEPRAEPLTIHQKSRGYFEAVFPVSKHAVTLMNRIRRKLRRLKSTFT